MMTCQQCGKRLSKKTARVIEGRTLCSSYVVGPSPLERAKASYRPMVSVDELLGFEREGKRARHGVEFSDEGRG